MRRDLRGREGHLRARPVHALEYASDAVKAVLTEGAERDRRFEEVRADIGAGRGATEVRELDPFSGR
ncbi:MAG: hypothetical protein F4145_17525, partial [Boseongicola sp. SB0675_bin_26]|nr:hypothetical protein [Boseongicola sp. SB0675_bin_26]